LVVQVARISAEAFAPYGEVLEARDGGDRDAAVAAWKAVAGERYAADLKPLPMSFPARTPELSFIEAHPNSPQLSVSFASPWLVTVVPGIVPGSAVGRDADVSTARSFLVPPGVGVILRAGLWHGPMTCLEATDVLVIFRADVVDEWTELDRALPLELPPEGSLPSPASRAG
jgi:ureidoglycolate lyase